MNMFDITSKLFDRLVKTTNGCLVFAGGRDTGNYGIIWKDGANKGAHIIAYEHYNGPVPTGMLVCHSCDNPPCCHEQHLFLGTKQDNYDDMVAKGRNYIRRGIEVNTVVLNEQQVIEIYDLLDQGYTQRLIAEWYGVTHSTIGAIGKGKNWRHLYEEYRT